MQAALRTYCLEEVCAERLRTTRQTQAKLAARGWARPRARDFYDLWHLLRLDAGRVDWTLVARVLAIKCAHRQVAILSITDIFEPTLLEEVRSSWDRTLGPSCRICRTRAWSLRRQEPAPRSSEAPKA
jgi:Nucleotidyl transferase AbiEii toxin, Type IV TA system